MAHYFWMLRQDSTFGDEGEPSGVSCDCFFVRWVRLYIYVQRSFVIFANAVNLLAPRR